MGGGLVGLAISRPVTVLVGVILTCLFGVRAVTELPIQLTPDIEVPTLTITTLWPGAAPAEVEADILERQEEVLKSLSGLVRMDSEARLEQGVITLELEVGTSIQEALVRVTNLLSQVPSYPANARQPVIAAANSSGPPMVVITITAPAGQDVDQHRTWVSERVQPQLERIAGVAEIRLVGGRDREVEIELDESALASRGLTISAVAQALRGELRDLSGGDLTVGKRRFLVRTPLAPATPQAFEEVVLAIAAGGAPILVRDVARVREGLRKPAAAVFADDQPALIFLLFREAGTNVLEVTREVRATVETLQESLLAPRGLTMRVVSDQTGYIEAALELVRSNLFLGGLLATCVLLLFLGSIRAAGLVSIAIPICSLGTALGMAAVGRTINVVSLAGMTFAVGMVVDNAIVVLENIDTWRKREPDGRIAALRGTSEVWGAILAGTLTTAVVFIPIIAWQDEVGEILRDIAVAISLAVIVSLVVSVLVIPSFSVRFLGKEQAEGRTIPLAGAADRMRGRIAAFVGRLAGSWVKSGLVVVLALAIAVGGALSLLPSMEYLPTGNRNFAFGILVPPPGYSVEEMGEVGARIQAAVARHVVADVDGVPAVERSFYVGNPANAFLGASVADPARTREFLDWYRGLLSKVPGMFAIATQASLFGRTIGAARGVEVDLRGPSLDALVDLGGEMMRAVSAEVPGSQVRPLPSLDRGAPEYRVRPKRDQAARVGLTGAEIALAVDALVDGAIIGELSRDGEPRLDVVLAARARRGSADRGITSRAELAAAPVATPLGGVVTLDTVADIEEALGPTVIRRIERSRAITLQVSPPESVALEDAMERIRTNVVERLRSEGKIPSDVTVSLSGTAGRLEAAKRRFGEVLLLAAVICFLLMAALFEDFLAPLAVMISVPLAGAGGVLGLRAVDAWLGPQTFDMITALGFVILIGVVVNNAILVVDGAVARLREGATIAGAVEQSVAGRLRPIFMSALTSLAGLLPMVVMPGSGSELYRGIGAIVLGGLALSTVLTVFVVPALFSLLWRLKREGAR